MLLLPIVFCLLLHNLSFSRFQHLSGEELSLRLFSTLTAMFMVLLTVVRVKKPRAAALPHDDGQRNSPS